MVQPSATRPSFQDAALPARKAHQAELLREIWDHRLVKKFAPPDRLPGRPADILSGAVGIADVVEPLLKDGDEVDPETMGNLLGLHPGMNESHIQHQPKSRQ